MAIVRLKKVTLLGSEQQQHEVLDGLQQLGCLHLIDLASPGESSGPTVLTQAISPPGRNLSTDVHHTLKYLQTCPNQRRGRTDGVGFELESVVREARENEQRRDELITERYELKKAIQTLRVWGSFSMPSPEKLNGHRLWFYAIPRHRCKTLQELPIVWKVVSSDHRFDYVVVISQVEPEKMPVTRVDLGQRSLSELKRRLESLETELDDLHWRRVSQTRWVPLLRDSIAQAEDQVARRNADQQVYLQPGSFAVQGWVAAKDADVLHRFAGSHHLAITVSDPNDDDSPPTLLKNPELIAGGQAATTFYATPGYRTWDPSATVFVSFSLFFAMIMADAGYALGLGVLLLLLWRKMGRTVAGRRARRLAAAVVITSIAYGVLVGSYFGLPPNDGSFLSRLHLINATDTSLMMRLSIGVGIGHLALAHLATAWRQRWSAPALGSLGWVAMLLGSSAVALQVTGEGFAIGLRQVGIVALACGATAVLLFSSKQAFGFSVRGHRKTSCGRGGGAGKSVTGLRRRAQLSEALRTWPGQCATCRDFQ